MLELKIINKDGAELFCEKAEKIDALYNGEYQEGDKIVIHNGGSEYLALKLDEALAAAE